MIRSLEISDRLVFLGMVFRLQKNSGVRFVAFIVVVWWFLFLSFLRSWLPILPLYVTDSDSTSVVFPLHTSPFLLLS